MKKLFCLISCVFLFMALLPVSSLGEANPFDPEYVHSFFGDYSIEDLLHMQKLVEIELEYRGYYNEKQDTKEYDVPVGKYTVGIDIPAGVYTVSQDVGMFGAMINVDNFDSFYTVMPGSPIGKLELTEGQTIEVQVGGVKFSKYTGLNFD